MITHKFREVTAFADEVTVLRRGRHAGHGAGGDLSHADMAAMMIGAEATRAPGTRTGRPGAPVLEVTGLRARDRSGLKDIAIDRLRGPRGRDRRHRGISGNGQMELMEVLTGQRPARRATSA
jgi:general nucleoside transport system ATP-binding protein